MKLKVLLSVLICTTFIHCMGCSEKIDRQTEGKDEEENSQVDNKKEIVFSSSDKDLERTFYWAKNMALSYVHDNSDPVGYWYEAALPGRQAFCMRDMAHQSVGAEILGLSKHNENMLTKFVENISDGKDWCSYWEIDKSNKPAPVDYTDDDHFWYNLNANFDIIYACLKVYQWTGNDRIVKDPRFLKFYKTTLNEYVERWQLSVDNVMKRPRFLHVKNPETNSHRDTRGLPSYVENYPNLTASSDLIASIYAGFDAYSKIALINNDQSMSEWAKQKAKGYRKLLEETWWDDQLRSYHTFWTSKNEFANGEGLTYMLWFNASDKADRIQATIQKIMGKKDWNVENQSHFPMLYYKLNYLDEAYKQLLSLRTVNRKEYPEVSYGTIEGVIGGTMGIQPVFQDRTIVTLPRLTKLNAESWVEITNLPVFGGYISVKHEGNLLSHFKNDTDQDLTWTASFMGEHKKVLLNGKDILNTSLKTDELGNKISSVNIKVQKGMELNIKVML